MSSNSSARRAQSVDSGIFSDASSDTTPILNKSSIPEQKKVPKLLIRRNVSYCVAPKSRKRKKKPPSLLPSNSAKEIEVIDLSDDEVIIKQEKTSENNNINDKLQQPLVKEVSTTECAHRLNDVHSDILRLSELLYMIINSEMFYKESFSNSTSDESAVLERTMAEKSNNEVHNKYCPQVSLCLAKLENILPFNEQTSLNLYMGIVCLIYKSIKNIYPQLELTPKDIKDKLLKCLEHSAHNRQMFSVLPTLNDYLEQIFLSSDYHLKV